MIPKTEIYFATRKTASAHVYITKGVGKVRINNVPVEMIPQETAREVILAPLEITGDLRDKIDISVRVRGQARLSSHCRRFQLTKEKQRW